MRYGLLLLLFSFLSFFAKAQWIQLDEPDGGEVTCLEKVGSQIWAGTGAGVYVSNDEGDSWTKSTLPYFTVLDIAAFEDSVFMIYNQGNCTYLIISADTGVSWSSPLPVGNPQFRTSGKLSRIANQLIVDFNGSDVYFSNDFGQTWFTRTYSFISMSSRGAFCARYNGSVYEFFYYNSQTDSFQYIDTINFNYVVLVDTVLYSIRKNTTQGFLTRSADYGQTWDTVHTFPFAGFAYRLRVSNDTLFAGSDFSLNDGVYSVDDGLTWNPTPVYPLLLVVFNDYVPISNNDFLGSDNNGVIRFSAGPIAYYRNIGINAFNFAKLFTYNGYIYASYKNATTRSADGGASWVPWSSFQVSDLVGRNDTICAYAYYFTDTPPDTYIISSTDNGATGYASYQGTVFFSFTSRGQLKCRFRSSGELLYANGPVIRRSNSLGVGWQDINVPQPSNFSLEMELLNDELYILNQNNELYKEVSGSWTSLYTCPSNALVYLCKLNNTIVLASNDSLRYSNDGGLTWNFAAGNGLPLSTSGTPVFPTNLSTDGITWYGSLPEGGLVYSSDEGATWAIMQTPFRPAYAPVIFYNNELYCIGYKAGIWKTQLPVSIKDISAERKSLRVYPNPAQQKLNFTDVVSTNAAYRIYDSQGKLVQAGKFITSSQIEIASLLPGMYCGVVVNEEKNATQSFRFIKD